MRRNWCWIGPEEGRKVDGGGERRCAIVAAKYIAFLMCIDLMLDDVVVVCAIVHLVVVFTALGAAARGAHIGGTVRIRVVRAYRVGPGDGEKGRSILRELRLLIMRERSRWMMMSIIFFIDGPFHRRKAICLPKDLVTEHILPPIVVAAAHFVAAGGGRELPTGIAREQW